VAPQATRPRPRPPRLLATPRTAAARKTCSRCSEQLPTEQPPTGSEQVFRAAAEHHTGKQGHVGAARRRTARATRMLVTRRGRVGFLGTRVSGGHDSILCVLSVRSSPC
jgi:hypothetical protein